MLTSRRHLSPDLLGLFFAADTQVLPRDCDFNFIYKQIIIIQTRPWWPAVSIAILGGPLTLQHYYCLSQVNKQLQPLDNEQFNLRSAVTIPEARLDFKAWDFWSGGVTAWFDVRVTQVNSKCNHGKTTSTIFKEQEEERKRKY